MPSAPISRSPRTSSSSLVVRFRNWAVTPCASCVSDSKARPVCRWPAPSRCTAASASRSEEHTSELQSLMRLSYAVFCLKKKKHNVHRTKRHHSITNVLHQLIHHHVTHTHNNL